MNSDFTSKRSQFTRILDCDGSNTTLIHTDPTKNIHYSIVPDIQRSA